MPLDNLPSLRETVDRHNLLAKKSLGQNFLLDANITDKIVRLSLEKQNLKDFSQQHVFEIGSGPGGLTRSILRAEPKKLTVVELDPRCVAIAREIQAAIGEKGEEKLEIISRDALKVDLAKLGGAQRQVVANLPYHISVKLLSGWLEQIESFSALTLMFQKEVADRIQAKTGTKDYGRISILAQLLCDVERLMDVSPQCFTPAPKIWSSVLLLRPLPSSPSQGEAGRGSLLTPTQLKNLETLTALAFSQRRKMIRSSLKSLPNLSETCAKLEIPLDARAEQLSPEQFLRLADGLSPAISNIRGS